MGQKDKNYVLNWLVFGTADQMGSSGVEDTAKLGLLMSGFAISPH